MSIMSESFGYIEECEMSHEFLRRCCSYTPQGYTWAGDLLLTTSPLLKQSEVDDMRGGGSAVEHTFGPVPDTRCGNTTVGIPSQYVVEETDIRSGGAESFGYHTPKNPDSSEEENWSLGLLQSLNECGEMMDGGDALQAQSSERAVASLCGTIKRSSGVFDAQAHYLDNRKSYSTDPDNGLLVCIRTGAVWSWEVRYSPKERDLSPGLVMSDDVTDAFTTALSALGLAHTDVIEFGMI